jgi:muramoyltetrapeptide carboxypeptidase
MASFIKPRALRRGDTIAVAAPSACFDKNALFHGIQHLNEHGFKTFFRPDIFARREYLAGNDERRADEMNGFFADGRFSAVFCARGGYGTQRILPLLDKECIRNNPKIVMGYSDITALHCFLLRECNLVSFHGPLVTELGERHDDYCPSMLHAFQNTGPWGTIRSDGIKTLRGGRAEGILAGGNLCTFASLLGTGFAPDCTRNILMLEDRGEKPYAVDRLLVQLKQAGIIKRIAGLILGGFIPPRDWVDGTEAYEREIHRIVLDITTGTDFPIVAGFPVGHIAHSICVPLGVRIALSTSPPAIQFMEPCLTP